jgi:hypothetical protein
MKATYKLWDGRKVSVEQQMHGAIHATFEGEQPKAITSQDYMRIVIQGTPVGQIE